MGFYFVTALFYVFFLNLNMLLFQLTMKTLDKVMDHTQQTAWIITNMLMLLFYTVWFSYAGV